MQPETFSFADLFSGAGGMSYGFHAHPDFRILGAADAEIGKPSAKAGSLECNRTYDANMGVLPVRTDLAEAEPSFVREAWGLERGQLDVLAACPPCTGFSRTTAANHVRDDPRNSLVGRVALYVEELMPRVLVMENARELVRGKQGHHLDGLIDALAALGYRTWADTHVLTRFGLPQVRERAVVLAVAPGLPMRTLNDLWKGYRVAPHATTVRHAIGALPPVEAGEEHPDVPMHVAPRFASGTTLQRMRAIPADGGSWGDLLGTDDEHLLIPAHRRIAAAGRLGSHPDVYGRMWWDEPARTIKRECAHVGNGRYAHPEQHRLCTVREMALLQGFPLGYAFHESTLANAYRHIGDAVPPLISYQLAGLIRWILTDQRPAMADLCLPGTSLRPGDIRVREEIDTDAA